MINKYIASAAVQQQTQYNDIIRIPLPRPMCVFFAALLPTTVVAVVLIAGCGHLLLFATNPGLAACNLLCIQA